MANLLPLSKKHLIVKHYRMRVLSVIVAMLALVSCIGVVLLSPSYLVARHALLNKFSVSGKHTVNEVDYEHAKEVISATQEQIDLLRGQKSVLSMVSIMDELTGQLDDTITINTFSYTRVKGKDGIYGRMILEGVARDRESLARFEKRLRDDQMVASVRNPVEGLAAKYDIMFQMTLEIVNMPQDEV